MGTLQETIIVVPCYNEAARLDGNAFLAFLNESEGIDFLFVDDGSTDATHDVLADLCSKAPARLSYLALRQNSGKAEAVRQGVLAAAERKPRLIGYWDADLATPLEYITRFRELFAKPDVMLVMGSRVQLLGHRIERSRLRHYIGRVFATLASTALDLPVYDTQCGAKLFRARAEVLSAFEHPFQLTWCFDMELLARLRRLEAASAFDVASQCVEYPLDRWLDVPGSKLNLKQAPRVAGELLRLSAIVRAERRR